MAYIYQITNDLNDKVYIGKTEFPIEKRFKEHCQDAFRERNEKRPLYAAMRKYGVEHFHIEVIEETDNPEEREIYWIEQKRSFKRGYNATLGGDGRKYLDYDLIKSTYEEVKSVRETARLLHIDENHCNDILKSLRVDILSNTEATKYRTSKIVGRYNRDNELLAIYPSANDAARALVSEGIAKNISCVAHIKNVCLGERKTAYGSIWKYL